MIIRLKISDNQKAQILLNFLYVQIEQDSNDEHQSQNTVSFKNDKLKKELKVEFEINQDRNQKQNFLKVLEEVKKLNLFADIDNPVQWQKNKRNEWEQWWKRY